MGIQVASLYAVLGLQDNLTGQLRQAKDALTGFGDRLQNTGAKLMATGAQMTALTAPLAIFGATGIRVAGDFDAAMREIQARTGLTGADLDKLRDAAIQMGADTIFSATDAANAMLQLVSSGMSAEEALAVLPAVMDGAAASGESLGYTADAVTDIMAMFNLEAGQSSAVMDALVKAAGSGSASVSDLVAGFQNVGPIAREMGLSVDETAAILQIFSENGIKGAEAGTQLRSMLNNMTRDTEKVQTTWAKLGISMYEANGEMRPLGDVIEDLRKKMDGMTDEERINTIKTLAGSYGQLGLAALLSGTDIDAMLASMDEAAGASEVAETRMQGWHGAVENLSGSIETLQIRVLTPFINQILIPLTDIVAGLINRVTDWAEENPKLALTITKVLAGLTALGPVLVGVGTAISGIGFVIGLILSPTTLLIAAIAGIAAAYYTNFGGVRDFIDGTIRPALEGFFGWLGGVWDETVKPGLEKLHKWFTEDALPAVKDFVTGDVTEAFNGFMDLLGGIWDAVEPALSTLFDWFTGEGLPAVVEFVTETAMPGVSDFIDLLKGAWDVIKPALDKIEEWFTKTALPAIKDFITKDVQPVIDTLIGALSGAWDAVKDGLEAFKNGVNEVMGAIKDVVDPVVGTVKDLLGFLGDAADFLGLGGEHVISVSSGYTGHAVYDVPYADINAPVYGGARAGGGPVDAGTAYWVGEEGPEIFVPSVSGNIVPTDRLAAAGVGARTTNVHVTVNVNGDASALGNVWREAESFAARIADELALRGVV